jgi:hypothetical protein
LKKKKTSNEESEKRKRKNMKIDKDRQGTSEERSAILWNAVALSLSPPPPSLCKLQIGRLLYPLKSSGQD